MSNPSVDPRASGSDNYLELPVEEVLRTAKPYPPREELVLDDLTDDEEKAFWEAISRECP